MKYNVHFTIQNIELNVEKTPVKLGEITLSCNLERSWFDMLLIYRMFNKVPSVIKGILKELISYINKSIKQK